MVYERLRTGNWFYDYFTCKMCFLSVGERFFFSSNKYVLCNIVSTRFLQSHGIERRLYIQVYVKITKLPLFSEKIEKLPLTVYIYGNVYTQYLPSLDLVFCTIVPIVIFFFLCSTRIHF